MLRQERPSLHRDERPRQVPLSCFLPEDNALVYHNDPVVIHRDLVSVQRPRSGTLKIYPLAVESASVAGALELLLPDEPIRGTTEMGANRREGDDAVAGSHDPDSVTFLETGINHIREEVFGFPDLEPEWGLETNVRKEKTREPGAKKDTYDEEMSPGEADDAQKEPTGHAGVFLCGGGGVLRSRGFCGPRFFCFPCFRGVIHLTHICPPPGGCERTKRTRATEASIDPDSPHQPAG